MIDLCERLTGEERDAIYKYMAWYGDQDCQRVIPREDLNFFLRHWNSEKQHLYHAFNENFILEKEISFHQAETEIADNMYGIFDQSTIKDFINMWKIGVANLIPDISSQIYLLKLVDVNLQLIKNAVEFSITIPANCTNNNKSFVIHEGAKTSKLIGQLCKTLPFDRFFDMERFMECYEAFRNAHSLALNQKVIKGTLCLSIHPLDYMTMSDSNYGWTSCMSWMENGEYRLGTIEMMNSSAVVVAYLKTETPNPIFEVNDFTWNSKRWRQLFIITKDIIVGSRQYAYANDDLQGSAIRWLRELMSRMPGYGPYSATTYQIKNLEKNIIGNREISFNFLTTYMYNDMKYDKHLAYFNENYEGDSYIYNYSGIATCVVCGESIYSDQQVSPSELLCDNCTIYKICAKCGEMIYRDDLYETADGCQVCSYCYNEMSQCEKCGNHFFNGNLLKDVGFYLEGEEYEFFNNQINILMCGDCIKSLKDIVQKENGAYRIYLEKANNQFLDSTDLPLYTIEYLIAMRDAESLKERLQLTADFGI